MNAHDFIPQGESELLEWLINFSRSFPEEGISLGITPAEIASLNALILSVIDDIEKGRSEENELQKEAMLSFVRLIVDKMKTHPNYNVSKHGEKLRML